MITSYLVIFHREWTWNPNLQCHCKRREDFKAYADVCFKEFGDRVAHWITIDEPNVASIGSYDSGQLAPGRCSDPFGIRKCTVGNSSVEPYIAVHNMLLAHASVTKLYREKYQVSYHVFRISSSIVQLAKSLCVHKRVLHIGRRKRNYRHKCLHILGLSINKFYCRFRSNKKMSGLYCPLVCHVDSLCLHLNINVKK